uniref:Endomucin n=1 Tax=Phocoena sinus TaxID=42100 RepID=A0A8C9CG71_PHOSS
MKLLQGTILCLLLSSLCSGLDDAEVKDTADHQLATKTSVPTSNTTSSPNVAEKSTVEISAKGATSKEPLETSLLSTLSSVTTAVNGEELGSTAKGATKTEFITTRTTVINLPLPNAISTLQSPQSKTEIQSSIKATETPGTPENGNDQPQSDKESVKLLTVKTISHESGEHSAQGKTKN